MHNYITVALTVLLTDPKTYPANKYDSKAVSTWLTGINTIIADRQVSANSPFAL